MTRSASAAISGPVRAVHIVDPHDPAVVRIGDVNPARRIGREAMRAIKLPDAAALAAVRNLVGPLQIVGPKNLFAIRVVERRVRSADRGLSLIAPKYSVSSPLGCRFARLLRNSASAMQRHIERCGLDAESAFGLAEGAGRLLLLQASATDDSEFRTVVGDYHYWQDRNLSRSQNRRGI